MGVLVTGGTGFIGANVVRELVAAGATVRVLARPGGDRRALEGIRVELAEGDLLDAASVRRAVAGVQTVYHVAADYRLWTPDPAALYRANVEGTRDTGLNIVHVRDVARGHLLAAERGKPGERYILGHAQGNLPLADIFRLLASITGGRAPRFRVPYALAWCSAAACEGFARVTG